MEINPTLTFMSGTPPNEVPITDLTVDKVRLVCVAGQYNGSVIFPDNMNNPQFVNLGNGQYGIGYFNHASFKAEIGSGYYYYVKVQRKIGGNWTDDWKHGVFYIGDEIEVLNYLLSIETTARQNADTAEARARANADALLMPKSGGTFTGNVAGTYFDNAGSFMYIGTNMGRVFIGNAQYGTPLSMGTPMYGNSMTTKNWVSQEITNRLATLQEGNYQESINIVRIIPEGVANAGQVYLNWLTALTYGNGLVNANKHLTVLVAGMNDEIGGVNLDFFEYDLNNHYYRCVTDYVHFRGLHAHSKILSDGNFSYPGQHFKAGALGRVIMEDLYFYFDNDGQTGEIENIIFKNCKFESRGGYINFINCQFEGLNTFQSTSANQFTFTSCYGFLFGKSEITSAGPYETPTKKFTPKIISKEHNFSEPITRGNASNGTLFLDVDNNDKLTYKDLDGNYIIAQESPNLIRLIPGGTEVVSEVYTRWLSALQYGNGYVEEAKQQTVLVCGAGTNGTTIPMEILEIESGVFSYVKDYQHWRGLGAGFKITADGAFSSGGNRFEAGAIDNIVMENLDFYFDDDEAVGEIKNIVFKNCSFESLATITFTNCRFEGKNYIKSGNFTFNNCTGTPIYSDVDLTISGINKILYETPTKKVTKQIEIKQIIFSEGIVESEAHNNSIFKDKDNGEVLSYKDNNGDVYTIDITPLP